MGKYGDSQRSVIRYRRIGTVSTAVFAAIASVLVPRPAETAAFTFKCAISTINDVQHEWCKRYAVRLEKRSNGQIKAQIFPAGQLGLTQRIIEGVQLGTIESYVLPPDFLVGIDTRFQVLTTPFLFRDMDHAYRAINDREFLDRFLALGESKGIKGVSLFIYGPASFVSRTPLRTPEDFKGKKIRVLATPIEMAMMNALGATGVPMPLGEVLPALQQGAMDAVESALTVFTTLKYYDVAKFHTNTNHYAMTSIGLISKKWYDSLSPDLQQAVVEEGRAVHSELLEWTKNFYTESVTIWKERSKGGWVDLTDDQRLVFRNRMEGVDEKVGQQVAGVKEWLDLLRAKAKQHAK